MKLSPKHQKKYEKEMVLTRKHEYSCCQKIICCRCFTCLQEEKVMDSDIRKVTIQRMIEAYSIQDDEKVLYDPIKLMILIYVCNDDDIPSKHIRRCKINPSTGIINYRTDLEFYIPQMCNYIVFHRNLENNYLKQSLEKMCKLNFYFAHLYYFYMKSIQKNITKMQTQILQPVVIYNKELREELNRHYQKVKLTCLDLYLDQPQIQTQKHHQDIQKAILEYQTTKINYGKYIKITPNNILLHPYKSLFDSEKCTIFSFQATILFFNDLFNVCEDLKNYENKKEKVIEYVKHINQNLPASVYIPFSKKSYRLCNILKIVTSEIRVFSTKQRAPVCLCFQIYCPSEHLQVKKQTLFWTNAQTPFTLDMNNFDNRTDFLARNYEKTIQYRKSRLQNLKQNFANIMEQEKKIEDEKNPYIGKENPNTSQRITKTTDLMEPIIHDGSSNNSNISSKRETFNIEVVKKKKGKTAEKKEKMRRETVGMKKDVKNEVRQKYEIAFGNMFGQSLKECKKRIRKNSIFGDFVSWDIFHLIVKTHDDLKQEQFAMQLIHQLDYIFKLEKLPLILTTYEVLSMGADRGIIEMVKDSVTFDSLKKTLKTEFSSPLSLKQFFQVYFRQNLAAAKENFLRSLAAYCLAMYVLQAKDRHNGNILLHRSGKIFHIDFGFFLSNMPGGGIQLQRDCPFKFMSEYVDVLDGTKSSYFKKFRQYFFQGFKAIRKHQNKIIMLVKMMYTSSGMSMPCFAKGEHTITALEARINPQSINNDLLLNEHCQQLINLSLDNWAAKWYDRFQYWAQGIFY